MSGTSLTASLLPIVLALHLVTAQNIGYDYYDPQRAMIEFQPPEVTQPVAANPLKVLFDISNSFVNLNSSARNLLHGLKAQVSRLENVAEKLEEPKAEIIERKFMNAVKKLEHIIRPLLLENEMHAEADQNKEINGRRQLNFPLNFTYRRSSAAAAAASSDSNSPSSASAAASSDENSSAAAAAASSDRKILPALKNKKGPIPKIRKNRSPRKQKKSNRNLEDNGISNFYRRSPGAVAPSAVDEIDVDDRIKPQMSQFLSTLKKGKDQEVIDSMNIQKSQNLGVKKDIASLKFDENKQRITSLKKKKRPEIKKLPFPTKQGKVFKNKIIQPLNKKKTIQPISEMEKEKLISRQPQEPNNKYFTPKNMSNAEDITKKSSVFKRDEDRPAAASTSKPKPGTYRKTKHALNSAIAKKQKYAIRNDTVTSSELKLGNQKSSLTNGNLPNLHTRAENKTISSTSVRKLVTPSVVEKYSPSALKEKGHTTITTSLRPPFQKRLLSETANGALIPSTRSKKKKHKPKGISPLRKLKKTTGFGRNQKLKNREISAQMSPKLKYSDLSLKLQKNSNNSVPNTTGAPLEATKQNGKANNLPSQEEGYIKPAKHVTKSGGALIEREPTEFDPSLVSANPTNGKTAVAVSAGNGASVAVAAFRRNQSHSNKQIKKIRKLWRKAIDEQVKNHQKVNNNERKRNLTDRKPVSVPASANKRGSSFSASSRRENPYKK